MDGDEHTYPSDPNRGRYIPLAKFAEESGIDKRDLYRFIEAGMPYTKAGVMYLVWSKDAQAWIDANTEKRESYRIVKKS